MLKSFKKHKLTRFILGIGAGFLLAILMGELAMRFWLESRSLINHSSNLTAGIGFLILVLFIYFDKIKFSKFSISCLILAIILIIDFINGGKLLQPLSRKIDLIVFKSTDLYGTMIENEHVLFYYLLIGQFIALAFIIGNQKKARVSLKKELLILLVGIVIIILTIIVDKMHIYASMFPSTIDMISWSSSSLYMFFIVFNVIWVVVLGIIGGTFIKVLDKKVLIASCITGTALLILIAILIINTILYIESTSSFQLFIGGIFYNPYMSTVMQMYYSTFLQLLTGTLVGMTLGNIKLFKRQKTVT